MIAAGLLIAAATLAPMAEASPSPRVSVDLKEADVRAVAAALAETGGVQIVMDPDVRCSITVALRRAAWPAALDACLKACGLGLEGEGALWRAAPLARLAAETAAARELAQARGRRARRSVESIRLTYARAEEMAVIVRKLLPGADVSHDARTNTLFVRW
jgi:type IV pilus assembly protein PilQ